MKVEVVNFLDQGWRDLGMLSQIAIERGRAALLRADDEKVGSLAPVTDKLTERTATDTTGREFTQSLQVNVEEHNVSTAQAVTINSNTQSDGGLT